MSVAVLTRPEKITVKRSELRRNQSRLLGKAKGRIVLVIDGPTDGDENKKCVLDKAYFDDLLKKVSKDPTGCSEGLSGPLRDFRSFHFGSHRVVYRVFEDFKAVTIVGIGAHSPKAKADIYRKLEALAETGRVAESILVSLRGFSVRQKKK